MLCQQQISLAAPVNKKQPCPAGQMGGIMKGKWSPGKITALVLGGIAAGMLLLATFWIGVAQLLSVMRFLSLTQEARARAEYKQRSEQEKEDSTEDYEGQEEESQENGIPFKDSPNEPYEEEVPQTNADFYEFHDEIRQDLSYQVELDSYAEMFGTENVLLFIEYPVVSGKEPGDMDGVNRAIQKEVEELREYVGSVAGEVDGESTFYFETESYITYMDEDVLSIAYVEYGYLDGEFYESYVVSVNIDMESKMSLTNSQILEINDQFSVDFRNRSERQNGEVSYLYNFTDQEITDLLNDDNSLIIFYTPLGMEVGFNYDYGYGWVTVTYKDYAKFQRHF